MRSILLVSAIAVLALARPAAAQTQAGQPTASAPISAFSVPALPYAFDALEPAIDAQTMQIHHDRHHQAYVTNLNAAVASTPALQGKSLEDILKTASSAAPAVRNNAGGHYNHSLFWTLMAPVAQGGEPSPALKAQIETDFGSIDAFKKAFEAAGAQRFGSGWAWLVWSNGKLVVTSTPNQDNPLMDDAPVKGAPIIANDVWEHAYYLKHQNNRGAYLASWWQVLNWNEANRLFDQART